MGPARRRRSDAARRPTAALAAVVALAGTLLATPWATAAAQDASPQDASAQGGSVQGGSVQGTAEVGGNWRQVDAGATTTCAVSASRHLFCWGFDGDGLLGNGGGNTDSNVPVEVAGAGADWDTVSVGDLSACARRTSGRLYCWGGDQFGALGNGGGNTSSNIPAEVAGGATDWASVSTYSDTTCAVKTTGHLFCWGTDEMGVLGNGGTDTDSSMPVEVAGGASNWAAVAVGNEHVCARKTTGRLFCWGRDSDGNLGDGPSLVHRSRPSPVAGNSTKWVLVSAGYRHTCAVKTTGRVYCWGWDWRGTLGTPGQDDFNRPVPTEVVGATADWSSVTGGSFLTCGRRVSGRLYCWGDNTYDELGNANLPYDFSPRPVRVSGGFTDWASVAAGGTHACAIRAAGALYCWGYNYYGQVGNGQTGGTVASPVPVVA